MGGFKVLHYVMVVAIVFCVAVSGFLLYERLTVSTAVSAAPITVEAARGQIVTSIAANGTVSTPEQAKLTFKNGGRVKEVLVKTGDTVVEGQPLVTLDDADLQLALAQAQSNERSAIARLEQTKAGSRPEEIKALDAQVATARLKLQQLQAAPNGPEMAAAQSQLEAAKIKLQQVQNGSRPEDVAAAQAQLEAANLKLQALLNPRPEDLAAAQGQFETAQVKLAQLQNPRAEDVKNAEGTLIAARARLQTLLTPRPEDLAAAQASLDQAKTRLAQLRDLPKTATPQDVGNAQLAVQDAQARLDRARANAAPPPGGTFTAAQQASADADVKSALIALQQAQNNLGKLQQQGPSDWDVRLQEEAVIQAQASLDKLRNPSAGDLLAAQAAVDQAQAGLDKVRTPSSYDVQAAQVQVDQARAALDKLRNPSPADVQAAQQAVAQADATLQKLLRPADLDVQAAQQALVQAQANVDKLIGSNGYDVQTAVLALNQAQANLDLKRAGPLPQEIAVAQAAVDQAHIQVQQAEANLRAAVLTAPFPGVIAAIGVHAGEQAGGSLPPITLVDTRKVRVDVVVDESDVSSVQPGQPAMLTVDALGDDPIGAKVGVVVPVGNPTQGIVNYQVQILVSDADAARLKAGMTATANIETARKDAALLVPNATLRGEGRTRVVEVFGADNKTTLKPVQTGLTNNQVTEVLSGLAPGDKIVVPLSTLSFANALGSVSGGLGAKPGLPGTIGVPPAAGVPALSGAGAAAGGLGVPGSSGAAGGVPALSGAR